METLGSGRLALQVKKAVTSLINHENSKSSNKLQQKGKPLKNDLLSTNNDSYEEEDDDDDASSLEHIYLLVSFEKMSDRVSVKPVRLALPHPFREAKNEDLSVCLITKDPQRLYKDAISKLGLKSITKVIGVSKLKSKFRPFEAKRQLCSSFDLFLADSRVIPMLPKMIGKTFFQKKKQPVAVDLSNLDEKALTLELQDAIQSSYFVQSGGSNISIKVGLATQNIDDVASNVESVLKQLVAKVNGGISNVRSIHIKTKSSVALPVFVRDAKV